ncbi:MAG: AAA family ATPase [Holosporales bacterium]|jgi:hypothetical protein|nr:AAA family ATPase [Holosporales bacterium]
MTDTQSLVLYGKNKNLNKEIAYAISLKYLGKKNEWYIRNDIFQDFLMMDGEKTMEGARSIIDFLNITSEFAGYKVVIINEAENMSKNVANAILKIIEEPPNKSLIIITTGNLFSLIPTIRSRCQKIFVRGESEKNFEINKDFFEKCMVFLKNTNKDVVNFVKPLEKEEELSNFLNILQSYLYSILLAFPKRKHAQKYLECSELIEGAKNTHLDQQTLVTACCFL